MAALAGIRLHEEFAGNFLVTIHLCRTGEKVALRTITFLVHSFRRICRILNASRILPAHIARIPRPRRNSGKRDETYCVPQCRFCDTGFEPSAASSPVGK